MNCKWLGEMPLGDLPNQDGYEFIGVRKDGTHCNCVIRQGDDGLHYIEGEVTYWELRGWKYKAQEPAP